MHLHSPTSAILSAVICNALIIPLLIPVALKGVRYRPLGADALLRRNLLVWGVGGVIVPFIGINLIDVVMVALNLIACHLKCEETRHAAIRLEKSVAAGFQHRAALRGLSAVPVGPPPGP